MAVDTIANGAFAAPNQAASLKPQTDKFNDLKVEDFLELMIAELQNQDPLNPTDNAKLVEQVNQIRNMQTSTQLNATLDAVLLGQNLSSAAGMIGKEVQGMSADGKEISGRVDKAAIENGSPVLYVGEQQMNLKNIRQILKD